MRLGLGTGSTARHVVDVLAERMEAGALRDIVGVPTSRATEAHARARGVPTATLDELERLDLTIDGADEIDPEFNLIKGLGGALLWEKIVAYASDRVCVVADPSKRVEKLGTRAPVPVEVLPFGWTTHLEFYKAIHGEPKRRVDTNGNGKPFVTDSGNYIIDVWFPDGIYDPWDTHYMLRERPGTIETGLFLELVTHVVIGSADKAELLTAPS